MLIGYGGIICTTLLGIINDYYYRCGPLVRFWCMRYEAKHNYFKSIAQRTKSFRNISKTLANHHQRLVCLYLNTEHKFGLEKEDSSGPKVIYWCT